jgi:hypothetical protein
MSGEEKDWWGRWGGATDMDFRGAVTRRAGVGTETDRGRLGRE